MINVAENALPLRCWVHAGAPKHDYENRQDNNDQKPEQCY